MPNLRGLSRFRRRSSMNTHCSGGRCVTASATRKITPQIERFDAVLIKLQRLVVDRSDEIFPRSRRLTQNRSRLREFLRLREHEGGEVFARKRTCPVK